MLNPKLEKYIATRDKKIFSSGHYKDNELLSNFDYLLTHKSIIVGGRASCGNSKNISWNIYTSWNEVIRKAKNIGYIIEIENIKQANKSPTLAGGFWQENRYTLTGFKNE